MKANLLPTLTAPLLLTGAASAGFVGLNTTIVETEFIPSLGSSLWVVNVYAVFDRTDDEMVAVAGDSEAPLDIVVKQGKFYQDPEGLDTPPFAQLLPGMSGALAYDTFVTIGARQDNLLDPADDVGTTPGFPFENDHLYAEGSTAWFIVPSGPGNGGNGAPDENGQVLIFQGSFLNDGAGKGISGSMLCQFTSNGVSGVTSYEFFDAQVPTPGVLPLLALAALPATSRRRRAPRR